MPFDGVDYDAAPFVWPLSASPGSPVDAIAIASALEVAYFTARRQNQLLVTQSSAWNGQRPGRTIGAEVFGAAADFVRWSDNYVFIPEHATRLVGHVVYAALPTDQCTVHLRLGAYDSSDTGFTTPIVGPEKTQPVNAVEGDTLADRFKQVFTGTGLSRETDVHEMAVDAAIDFFGDTRVFVEGYLAGETAAFFLPLFISIWWEVQES